MAKPEGAMEMSVNMDYCEASVEDAFDEFNKLGGWAVLNIGAVHPASIRCIQSSFPVTVVVEPTYSEYEWSLHSNGQIVWSPGA